MAEVQKEFKFKLYNQEWKLKLVKNDEMNKILENEDAEIRDPAGCVVYRNCIIYVNEEFTKGAQLKTLLHEMVHIFLLPTNGSQIYHDAGGVDLETACNLVANCLIELCNQKIFKFDCKAIWGM